MNWVPNCSDIFLLKLLVKLQSVKLFYSVFLVPFLATLTRWLLECLYAYPLPDNLADFNFSFSDLIQLATISVPRSATSTITFTENYGESRTCAGAME